MSTRAPGHQRIVVCCPAGGVTGGPEALHQLARQLLDLGHDAGIAYTPGNQPQACPPAFARYAVPELPLLDDPDCAVVIPEVWTGRAAALKRAKTYIWWLSVDNYVEPWLSPPKRLRRYLRSAWSTRPAWLPMFRMRKYGHLAQSEYAAAFLAGQGLHALPVTDYLAGEYAGTVEAGPREDVILFNPAKGYERTRALIARYPQFTFQPLAGMERAEMAATMRRAKLYVDLGSHPGKDRIPREAAMSGCCIVTNRRGSAAGADVPIPEAYKLDDTGAGFLERFGPIAERVFASFDAVTRDFDPYRLHIAGERERFALQVAAAFGDRRATGDAIAAGRPG